MIRYAFTVAVLHGFYSVFIVFIARQQPLPDPAFRAVPILIVGKAVALRLLFGHARNIAPVFYRCELTVAVAIMHRGYPADKRLRQPPVCLIAVFLRYRAAARRPRFTLGAAVAFIRVAVGGLVPQRILALRYQRSIFDIARARFQVFRAPAIPQTALGGAPRAVVAQAQLQVLIGRLRDVFGLRIVGVGIIPVRAARLADQIRSLVAAGQLRAVGGVYRRDIAVAIV